MSYDRLDRSQYALIDETTVVTCSEWSNIKFHQLRDSGMFTETYLTERHAESTPWEY